MSSSLIYWKRARVAADLSIAGQAGGKKTKYWDVQQSEELGELGVLHLLSTGSLAGSGICVS